MAVGHRPRSFVKPPSPRLLGPEFREFVAEQYGPFLGWQALGGEDDLNLRIERKGADAFLKVSWVDDHGFADFQTELTGFLSSQMPTLPVPAIIPTLSGARSVVGEQFAERPLHLRMTSFLPGVSARGVVMDSTALKRIGRLLARLDGALAELRQAVPSRPTNWNIMTAAELLGDVIPATASERQEDHRVWGAVLDDFVAETLPRLATWPNQLIHNDLNGSNLLLDPVTGEVTGLLDFGDVVEAPRVIDLAVAAAYLVDGSSPASLFASLSAIVAGYQSQSSLSSAEIAIVPEIMKARYAMALALNHARASTSDDPDYVRYVLRNAEPSRTKLAVLTNPLSSRLAHQFRETRTASARASTSGRMANSFDPSRTDELPPATRAIVHRRHKLLGPAYRLQYAKPAEFVRGEGVWLVDADGRRVLDAYNNVPSVGHCHPHVVEAITRQASTLNTNTRYLDSSILDYAERLLGTHDEALENVMFTCTGSEAIDLALRVSRYHTDAEGVIVTSHAYHGVTAAAAAISPSLGKFVALGKEVRAIGLPFGMPADLAADWMAEQVAVAIADLERHGVRLAAFVVDTLFASDGILADPAGLLVPSVEAVHAAGGLFVADEVQPGFGRTGEAMWGYQRHGVRPDIAVMGKPMGNGMPIAGIAAKPEILDRFGRETRYFNTFGGNSVSIAAAAAVLDVIENEDLLARARTVGASLRSRLQAAVAGRAEFGELRAAGLYLGLDLLGDGDRSSTALTAEFVNSMRNHDVLISATGAVGQTLKIRPPLVFDEDNIETFLQAFSAAMADIER
jgi:4-aminobutyrate aminotransferase-like enzyme/Ser/Thr protein kinase RdoA (MazF antagonist)